MEPEHHDPFSEGAGRALEKLMTVGVLTEALSRLAAEHARARAAREERRAEQDRAAQRTAEQAARMERAEAKRRTRQWQALLDDPRRLTDYLTALDSPNLARLWRQTAADPTDPVAARLHRAAEDQLRFRWPTLMAGYDAARRDGHAPIEAMRIAAETAFRTDLARPHGASVHAPGGELPRIDEQLAEHLRTAAADLDPVGRARLERILAEQGWSPETLAYVQSLLDRADRQRQIAASAAHTPDNPAMTSADEHGDGLDTAVVATGRADQAATAAAGEPARLARLSFAVPATAVIVLRPAAPGEAPPAAPIRRPGRTR